MRFFIFNITSRCNFSCPQCLRGSGGTDDLPLQQYLGALTQLERIGYEGVSFTGGEPGLHPAFPEMAREAARRGFRVAFISNGSLLDRYRFLAEDLLGSLHSACFSLDGSTARLHNELRPPGSFARVIEAVRHFVDRGVHTKILMTLSRVNRYDIGKMVELADTLGIRSLVFSSLITTPQTGPHVLNDAEKRACTEEIGRYSQRPSGARVFTCSTLSTRGGIDFCTDLKGSGVTVNPKGELVFCCDTIGSGAVLGFLKDSPLVDHLARAFEVSRKLKKIRHQILKEGPVPEGFDTCDFCNWALARLIRHPEIPKGESGK